jgi:signal transduction histidine kinase
MTSALPVSEPTPVPAANRLRVLVVDDEVRMRQAVLRTLQGAAITLPDVEGPVDFELLQTGTGEEALALLDREPVDILLLDHKLPGLSGLDVLEQVAQRRKDCLTIIITAYASLETAVTATKLGAYDFLAKPFTPAELKATVRKTAKHLMLQRQARALAEEKHRVRFQLISVVAHELKAPLAVVESYLHMFTDRVLGEEVAAYEKPVTRSIERLRGMRKLIVDLLDLTRIESGEKKRDLVSVDLVPIARTSIETVTPDALRAGITIHFDAPPAVTFDADPDEMEIVFNNLLTNAVRYNKPDGEVFVRIEADPERLVVSVRDTGIGMTDDEAATLFKEFVRIRNKKTRDILGSGLGLSILKKIAGLYGGEIKLDSEPDVGSTFTVILPRTRPE